MLETQIKMVDGTLLQTSSLETYPYTDKILSFDRILSKRTDCAVK